VRVPSFFSRSMAIPMFTDRGGRATVGVDNFKPSFSWGNLGDREQRMRGDQVRSRRSLRDFVVFYTCRLMIRRFRRPATRDATAVKSLGGNRQDWLPVLDDLEGRSRE